MATDGIVLDTTDSEAFRFPFQLEYEGVTNFPDEQTESIWYD